MDQRRASPRAARSRLAPPLALVRSSLHGIELLSVHMNWQLRKNLRTKYTSPESHGVPWLGPACSTRPLGTGNYFVMLKAAAIDSKHDIRVTKACKILALS
jgi:hypothetical protein